LAGVQHKSKIQLGFASAILEEVNANDAMAAVKVWSEVLGRDKGLWEEADVEILDDNIHTINQVRRGKLDIIGILTCDYIAIEHELAATPVMTPIMGNHLEVNYSLLVPDNTVIKTLDDLEGKRIAIPSKSGVHSLAGLWLDVHLMNAGFGPKEVFFKEVKNAQKPSQAILSLFFNQVDAAIVSSSAFETAVELNPQLGRRLKIFATSKPFVTSIVCVRNGLDEDFKKEFVDSALNGHNDPRAFQTFIMFKMTRIVRWETSYLRNTRELIEQFKRLSNRRELLARQAN
jgi:ABC-type phosphate/phosphonate transport system substrate-binding protein